MSSLPRDIAAPISPDAGVVERLVRSPGRFCLATLALTVVGLWLDGFTTLPQQMLLSTVVWGYLVLVFFYITPIERAQTVVVIVVATTAEIIGSIIWGVYEYRLGNLPLFVPAGHGLIYLFGLRLSQTAFIRARANAFRIAAALAVATWAVLGLVALPQLDVAGASGALLLLLFLWRGRAPTVYAGVFVAVAFLEIYGTAIGTWTWAEAVPILGIPDGNPPSGIAGVYVMFDIAALALAPAVLAALAIPKGWFRRRDGVSQEELTDQS
ncbi:MAG: hypothetical protein ACR2N6_05945 [Miltoncostaeaceae bacterium]